MDRFKTAVCCVCLAGISFSGFAQEKDQTKKPKPYDKDQLSLAEMIGENREYKAGDLLTWEDVKPYIEQLKENGIEIPDEENLPAMFLPEGDRVVKMLRTRKGTIFMRNLTKAGGKYDMVDRFRKLPRGYTMLQTMIDTPKGHQLLADMVTAKTGKGTAQQLTRSPEGKDFDKPTGLIYTEDALLDFLKAAEHKSPPDESPDPPKP
ncbi:MAG TPA: hypothetical protein VMM56_00030 [Planctomycetaceae bacterium]|nr:hypothetical protein [Planctomycetaceae bacterium]